MVIIENNFIHLCYDILSSKEMPFHNFFKIKCRNVLFPQIVFEGIRGSGYRGDIAIDDIKLINGRCQQTAGWLS